MPYLNAATDLYVGSTPAVAAYLGTTKVWPPTTNSLSASLRIASNTEGKVTVEITAQYVGTPPASYKFYSNTGSGWTFRYSGEIGPHYFDTTYNTNFTMKVESYTAAGVMLSTVTTATLNTGDRPTVQRSWASAAAGSRTYNGSNADRGVAEMYYGYYSSTHGIQKSRFWFNIPADMRNCVSIDRIDLAIWGQHTFPNGGNNLHLAIIHDANNVGSTDALNWTFNVPRDGWVGPHDGSGWCIGLQGLVTSGRPTMAEEFRVQGAVGFQLVATTTAQSGYGYCQGASQPNYPRMRIWYTVYA